MNIFFQILILFFVYSFIGWIIETIYCSVLSKKLINRGFLKGPYCPMYGFSALSIIMILDSFVSKINLTGSLFYVAVFLVSVIISTVIEFFTGVIIDKVFKMRLWDYSDKKLNVKGHICLEFSIYWGVLAFVLLTIINPIFSSFASRVSVTNYRYIFLIPLILIILDLATVLRSLVVFNRLVAKINILNINHIVDDFKKHKRILKNFVPNFYSLDNYKLNKVKERIMKTILKRK